MAKKQKNLKRLNKAACFTDIHFGRKNNSELHNKDCIRFIKWFCENVKSDPNIDHIIFLGDWHEHRSAINGLTLKYSYAAAQLLNKLNLPVYIIVGNHDLYYRNNREVFTTNIFESLENFIIVDEPTVFKELGDKGALISPFMFHDEYPSLVEYFKIPVWFGHFEFKGFVLTGESNIMEHGPNPEDYNKPNQIFTGHFHKRQSQNNIHYIGNTFPADFSDANDNDRGMMVYQYDKDHIEYINWLECPKYVKVDLSVLLSDPKKYLEKDARVKCLDDIGITFDEKISFVDKLTKKYKLREFDIEESMELKEALEDGDMDLSGLELESTINVIKTMLNRVDSEQINNEKLISIYEELE